jgi:hypothetical protein
MYDDFRVVLHVFSLDDILGKIRKKMCIDPTLGCITYFVIRILNETIEDTSITFYFTVNHVLQVFGPNKMYE